MRKTKTISFRVEEEVWEALERLGSPHEVARELVVRNLEQGGKVEVRVREVDRVLLGEIIRTQSVMLGLLREAIPNGAEKAQDISRRIESTLEDRVDAKLKRIGEAE